MLLLQGCCNGPMQLLPWAAGTAARCASTPTNFQKLGADVGAYKVLRFIRTSCLPVDVLQVRMTPLSPRYPHVQSS